MAVSEGQRSENEIRYPWKGECCTQRKEKVKTASLKREKSKKGGCVWYPCLQPVWI